MTKRMLVPANTHPSRVGHRLARFVGRRPRHAPSYYAVIRKWNGEVNLFEFDTPSGFKRAVELVRSKSK